MIRRVESNAVIRLAILLGGYALILFGAYQLGYQLRFDFYVPPEYNWHRTVYAPLVVALQLVSLAAFRQFGSLLTYFGVPDLLRIVAAVAASNLVLVVTWYVSAARYAPPRGVILADFVFAVIGLCCLRLSLRIYRERFAAAGENDDAGAKPKRIVIIGAGDVGARLAYEAANRPRLGLRPVCFLDDDVAKHNRQLHGIPVEGAPEKLASLAKTGAIDTVVIAMPSASARRVRDILRLATEAKLKVEVVPSMSELTSGRVQVSRIRPVDVEDLLGREPVELDSEGIRKSIHGKVVLVTGAGGSIGSELCRQIAALAPKQLLLVEQAEGALFLIEQELNELGLGTLAVPLVGDILDQERMRYIFRHYEPDVVFHAAAHKHVYLMERQPAEAIRNNVLGTRRLAEIAVETGVDAFVLISTDKAINPTNVMGATKRLAEIQLMAISAEQGSSYERKRVEAESDASQRGRERERVEGSSSYERKLVDASIPKPVGPPLQPGSISKAAWRKPRPTKFMAVRFGNVLGSSGSVVPIFKRQIAAGGPVTVTHPDVTRYFMTIPEAVGLVLQASILGQGGEIFVLDMGQPVKIVDLAKQMIELSGFKVGDDIEIKFTGLKPGEKLYEELQHKTEQYTATDHPRIMRFTTNAMFSESGVQELSQHLYDLEPTALKQLLKRLVPEYTPFLD